MIKVEHIETWGFKHAIRGMRNPMNSWNKSDSSFLTIKKKSVLMARFIAGFIGTITISDQTTLI